MTELPTEGQDAAEADGGYLTVEQLAQVRQVTPAAIRAQLRTGTLAGEQVLQGQRTVWRIPVSAARRYLQGAATPQPPAPDGRAGSPPASPAPPASPVPVATATPEPAPPVAERSSSRPAPPASSERVAALESEVRRLRRQLAALAEAHRSLLDAVTVDLAGDP